MASRKKRKFVASEYRRKALAADVTKPPTSKRNWNERVQKRVAGFLRAGGTITKLPPKA